MSDLEKAWPKEYDRVRGQTKDKGVASKKQYRYMAARAADGDQDAKDYVKNSPKSGEGLPDEGTDGARGERVRGRHQKRKKKDGDHHEKVTKSDDIVSNEDGVLGTRAVHLNRHYEVRYLAGYSQDGRTIYIDRRLPPHLDDGTPSDKYLLIHEVVEKALIDRLGFPYEKAHEMATKAERKAVEDAGISWDKYEGFMDHWIQVAESRTPDGATPPDLDHTPYKRACRCAHDVHEIEANVEKADRPKLTEFQQQVEAIKQKYSEKKPKTFQEQVEAVKAKYKKPIEKATDLFFGKVEGLLEKGYSNQELVCYLMDAELLARGKGDEKSMEDVYKAADRLFDAAMSKEEQAVYELSYLAKCGDEVAETTLAKLATEMYGEMLKHLPIEDAVKAMVKSNYGPKGMGLYNQTDNINRKAKRTGMVHESVGHNQAEQKYTPSVNGTFAQQATREAKADQAKSKSNPVKVYSEEEKAKLMAAGPAKKQPLARAENHTESLNNLIDEHKHLVHVLKTPNKKDDKEEAKRQSKELHEYEKEKANKSEDNSKVKGKVNGASYRMVHGYKRYTSGPKRGEYVHRHEAEKRIGRKLGSKEHVDHKDGNRAGTKNTKVMSASAHSAKTNSTRANNRGFSGKKRYEHTRD